MNSPGLIGMKVAILLNDDFEQIEMTDPRNALRNEGAETFLIGPHSGQVQGFDHDEKGSTFDVDLALGEASPNDYDALLLPGGVINSDKLRANPAAKNFAVKMDETAKPIAVICHAPWLLISAGLVHGRILTSYYTLKDDIRNAGGQWLDKQGVCDRNWVSSRSPRDLPVFNRLMIDLFSTYWARNTRRQEAA